MNVSSAQLHGAHNDLPSCIYIKRDDEVIARIGWNRSVEINPLFVLLQKGMVLRVRFNKAHAGISDDLPVVV